MVEQVGEQLGIVLGHPDVDAVSGLFLSLLDRPAEVGDRMSFCGVEFRVRAIQGRGVRECVLIVGLDVTKSHMMSSRRPRL